MVKYFLLFSFLGFCISKIVESNIKKITLIVLLAIAWGVSTESIWGLATLAELLIGASIQVIWSKNNSG
jgi:hypothetical protein